MNDNKHSGCIEAMNDLVEINNDRIKGYQTACNELRTEDEDLRTLFTSMIDESRGYNDELSTKIQQFGGSTTEGTTMSGKLYRTWMEAKALFTGGDRTTVLNNCEGGEDAAQKAYEMALNDDDVMQETKSLISRQKDSLKQSHDQIKMLRDQARNS